ncbi:MAG: hypothetical protein ACFB21_16470 [Opitutales bacterium]
MATEAIEPAPDEIRERPKRRRPRYITYVSLVFVVLGTFSLLEMFFEMSDPRIPVPSMNFLISFIPLGIGLFRGHELSRVIAVNCAAVVGGFYFITIIFHFVINRRLDLFYAVIFWVIAGGAMLVSIYAIFCLSRRTALEFFGKDADDDDL